MIRFIFGFEARDSLKARADELPADAYSFLERSPRYQIRPPLAKSPSGSNRRSSESEATRRFTCLEMVAEFDYQPVACKKSYRMIALRKRVGVDEGQMRLFEDYRYHFYITNDRK